MQKTTPHQLYKKIQRIQHKKDHHVIILLYMIDRLVNSPSKAERNENEIIKCCNNTKN